ncbi:MAG: SulP family inorganic anion transporter [Sulfurovum sp.]|nr:SulP family inorganic anion transporter [Sulfurovum sp.]MCB4750426.1 SulP family inorganic anion transporter [Sulfurovum sp.]MCB4754571.1 SulP family inorganic anion transporter [Sulfurovum sp.]MCB4766739.1 SulP family inorganic anion transporter [Sulfurovum sp.]MCB4780707.1 SulP family inorganic anion transporter [Sulfurovum sp.]
MVDIQRYSKQNIKNDILSGALVSVALVPEAIAFSFIAGVSPVVGLYAAFIIGLITSLLGGKPGMVSGATGSVAVVFISLGFWVKQHYPELDAESLSMMILHYILITSILAGIIQTAIGLLKMGKFIRLVPQPALFGFVNGLAIVIALAQLPFLAPTHIEQYNSWLEIIKASLRENYIMYTIIASTMMTMQYLPKLSKAVPAGLVAIVVITLIVYFNHIDTKTVGDMADLSNVSLPHFVMPNLSILINWESLTVILSTAIIVALVGLIESLLTLSVLDEMGGKRGSGNRECVALGLGNTTAGLFGGMAGCAMIGQSVINFTSGGLGRLSSFTASVLLIILVVSFSGVISIIPIAVLVGIMFMVSIGTFEFSSVKRLKHMPKSDAFVLMTVTIITIFFDLAVAVIAGIIISALVFAWKHAKIYAQIKMEGNKKIYELDGPLFFGSVTSFNEQFDAKSDPEEVVIDFKKARVMDSSGAEAIDALTEKYKKAGKKLTLRHLSEDCKKTLKIAGPFCTYEEDDPTYKVAMNV